MSIVQNPARAFFTNLLAAAALCPLVLAVPAQAGFEWTPPPQARKAMPPVAAAPAMEVDKEPLVASPDIVPFPLMETIDGVPQESMMTHSPFDEGGDDFDGAASTQEISPFDDPQDLPAAQPRRRPPPIQDDAGSPAVEMTGGEHAIDMHKMMKAPAEPAPPEAMQPAPAPAPVMAVPVAPAAPVQVFAAVDGFGSDIPLVLAMRQIVPADYAFAFDPGVNQGARISWDGGAPWNEVLDAALRPLGLAGVVTGRSVWIRRIENATAFMPALNGSAILPEPMGAPVDSPQLVAPVMVPAAMEDAQRMAVAEPFPVAIDAAGDFMPPQSYPRRQNPRRAAVSNDGAMTEVMDDPASQYSGGQLVYAAPARVMAPVAPVPQSPAVPVAVTPFAAAPTPITPGSPFASAPAAARPVVPLPVASPAQHSGLLLPASPPAAPGYAAAMDPLEIRFWNAPQGVSLKQVLQQWTSSANVALLWNSPFDYVLPVPVALHGTFPDAVTGLLTAYNLSDPRPLGRLHSNLPQGPSVLVIENWTSATN